MTIHCVTRYLFSPLLPWLHAQCKPFLSFIHSTKKGEERGEKEGNRGLKDDESGRKQKPDGFLSWLSSRCRLQQTAASMRPGEETGRQLCGNADPDCSYQLCCRQNKSTTHKTLPQFKTLHTHVCAMQPFSYDGCWLWFWILGLISTLKKQDFVAHLWTFNIWSYCRHLLSFTQNSRGVVKPAHSVISGKKRV